MKEMKLMLVDDEERFLATSKKLLEKKGYETLTATSGIEALEKLKTQYIHVVILDVKMPGLDGVATLRMVSPLFTLHSHARLALAFLPEANPYFVFEFVEV